MASKDELVAELSDLRGQVKALDAEYAGVQMPDDAREQWNTKNERIDVITATLDEIEAREQRVKALDQSGSTERPEMFQVKKQQHRDIYDLAAVRRDSSSHEQEVRLLGDHAMRAIEGATFPHPDANKEDAQAHIERLLEIDGESGEIRRRILSTGSPAAKRAFVKYISGREMTNEERAALATTSTGVPIPFTLDPTIIPTSNFSVNPFRAISRVVTITGSNTWEGATSGAITAARANEAAEASDNTPTLTQPSITVSRVQAFVPMSFEVAEDWGGVVSEMAMLFQDAKDDEEATAYFSGNGTAPNPTGILGVNGLGTAVRTQTAGTAAFTVADVYNTETNLPPRWQPRASWVMHRKQANRIRQFDTAGGASLWIDNLRLSTAQNQIPRGGSLAAQLVGYPAYELSTAGTSIASGSKILIFGDFSRGFVIVDRVGMDVELIPHLFGTANNYPTGQRGLYARWRNGAKPIVTTAFQYLEAL